MKKQKLAALCALLVAGAVQAAVPTAGVNVDAFVKNDMFDDIKLSPNGDYYAATVKGEDRTILVVLRRSDNAVTAKVGGGKYSHVDDFWWVNSERIVVSMAKKIGWIDQPLLTGDLYAVNADGGQSDILAGQSVNVNSTESHIKGKQNEQIAAFLIDDLPADDKYALISVSPFSADPYTRVDKMDVYSGRRTQVTRAPVRNAYFVTDNQGVVRFASGSGVDNVRKVYYRESDGAEWRLIQDEGVDGVHVAPLGFSADNKTAYLQVEKKAGPDAIETYDIATGTRKELLRDKVADPSGLIYQNGTMTPIGLFYSDGKPRTAFFDATHPEAKLYRGLEGAFGGEAVRITSQTSDGKLALVQVWSDRNPGDFYLFDTVNKKATYLLSRRTWLAPEKLATTQAVEFTARDGLPLHGLLTVPRGSDGKNLPMILLPHGGPFDIKDSWSFDSEVAMLTDASYAVLRVNFRGSGGYGRAFAHAGAKQWGKAMQDDLTDATRWAIAQGIADAKRICIYGASYGGYAALMGVAKEPDLYQCAVGYVGVYDLPTMHTDGDIQGRGSGETYLREWIGERAELGAVSPNRMADRIKVPVFLAAGGEDERAPIAHSKMMEKALRAAGTPVETLYYDTEGHGFYLPEHRREYYTRLLAFLGKHLGGAVAAPTGAAGVGK